VDDLTNPEEFHGVAVAQPAVEHGFIAEPPDHVGQRDVVLLGTARDGHNRPLHDNAARSFAVHRRTLSRCRISGMLFISFTRCARP
jgi:hypothetical protein